MTTRIENPANADHWMTLHPIEGRVRLSKSGTLVADTTSAFYVVENGKTLYDPRVYFPASDLTVEMSQSDKTTHCPLKGDASYFTLNGEELGWRYSALPFAAQIDQHVSLWDRGLTMEISHAL